MFYEYDVGFDGVFSVLLASLGAVWFIALAASIFLIVVQWKLFEKAGKPGWASLVPFYNSYVLYELAFGNGWLFLLGLVPIVNVIVSIILPFKLAKSFGQSAGFGAGLLFLNIVFLPILAFGKSTYVGLHE